MVSAKQHRPHRPGRNESVALMAIGSSGPWEVAIDQTTSGPERWFTQIEGPSAYLYFEIPSLQIVEQAIEFLGFDDANKGKAPPSAANDTLVLATSKTMRINLVRDDEFSDRYFLVLGPAHGLLVQLTLSGGDLMHLTDALRQVREDLE
jgi:hypothetical protein